MSGGYVLTDSGRAWCQRLGFKPPEPSLRRRFAYPCLDWSERRDHLAGQLADQLYLHLVAQGWVRRGAGRCWEGRPELRAAVRMLEPYRD